MYNIQLEQTVAKILMHNPSLLGYELLDKEDFFTDVKDVIEKMLVLYKSKHLINETTVGVKYSVPTQDEVTSFEELVIALKELSATRKIQNFPRRSTDIVLDGKLTNNEKIVKLRKMIDSYTHSNANTNDFIIENQIETYKQNLFNSESVTVVQTGIDILDRYIGGGMRNSEFILVAGDTKNYKSTLMYNTCLNIALRNLPVMLFSYEVDRDEVIEIFISMLAKIDSTCLKNQIVDGKPLLTRPDIIKRIEDACDTLAKLPLYIIDDNSTLMDIKMMGLRIKPAFIAIDYIQIMPDMANNANKVVSVEDISRGIKLMAKRDILNCPIMALSQFSKPQRGADAPSARTIHDLKWASSLSQDANVVIFTRKEVRETHQGTQNLIKISIEAQRNGVGGTEFTVPIVPKYHLIGG